MRTFCIFLNQLWKNICVSDSDLDSTGSVDLDSAGSVDPDSGKAKWTTKKQKNVKKSSFELLDVLFGGLGDSPVT
jgi:hypothetical protein